MRLRQENFKNQMTINFDEVQEKNSKDFLDEKIKEEILFRNGIVPNEHTLKQLISKDGILYMGNETLEKYIESQNNLYSGKSDATEEYERFNKYGRHRDIQN